VVDAEPREEDLTSDPKEKEAAPGLARPPSFPYDPSHDREKKRGHIAMTLVCLLFAIVAASFVYILFRLCDIETLKSLLEIVFAPIVGLVGAVTGFYFGEKSGK
jgi:hypothetical protein